MFYGSYSFYDVQAAIAGPGGATTLKGAAAEEGLTIAPLEDKNTMTVGADGSVMHSLHCGKACTVTVRLLKTSPINAVLRAMYNAQDKGAKEWGKNTITILNVASGDAETVSGCAFARLPENAWGKDGNVLEWQFHGAIQSGLLGPGDVEG